MNLNRLKLQDGDVIVVTMPANSTPEDARTAYNNLQKIKLSKKVTFLVVQDGISVEKLESWLKKHRQNQEK